ncbi:hypothetical protein [Vibrio crassostreae]|uniref:hypothetical protein n=2 Tax=Vibrio crassostreae TaxID=246167 RepID=UPI001B304158|nr:hypothetical protein [Vibrio crassostreae]
MDKEMETVQIPADKLVDALLHMKQFEHHYATQESVDNLKESGRELKSDTNKRFDQVDKRFDKLEGKLDRLQWFILASVLTLFFKEQIFSLFI